MFKFLKTSPKEQELIELLKKSRQDFRFDQDKVKIKLMRSIRNQPEKTTNRGWFVNHGWLLIRGMSLAVLVIFAGTGATFAYASNILPGDPLYSINIWGDKTLLSLPMPAEAKIWVNTKMAEKRLGEIHLIHGNPSIPLSVKAAAVKHSNDILRQTVKETNAMVKNFQTSGRTDRAKKIKTLSSNSQQQLNAIIPQQDIEELKNNIEDPKLKKEVEKEIQEMKTRMHEESEEQSGGRVEEKIEDHSPAKQLEKPSNSNREDEK